MPRSAAIRSRPASAARVGRTTAFWGLAATLGLLLFASSAPSPLYVVYQREFGFEITLTSVFAVYAVALLASLVLAGSVSDHVGRRPTLAVALVIEIVGMLAFAEAGSVAWLFAARTLQGLATGIAMGAISAALLDLQPTGRARLGALMGVVAPLSGLAALVVGVAVALAALGVGSTGLFLVGATIAGLGFGPAFAGAFRSLSNRAPHRASRRLGVVGPCRRLPRGLLSSGAEMRRFG